MLIQLPKPMVWGLSLSRTRKMPIRCTSMTALSLTIPGGLHDMEDATFGELNKRGMYRSIALANKLYEKYQRGEYFL